MVVQWLGPRTSIAGIGGGGQGVGVVEAQVQPLVRELRSRKPLYVAKKKKKKPFIWWRKSKVNFHL